MNVPYARRSQLAETLRTRKEEIARTVTDEFLDRHPDWVDRYGEAARVRGEEDAAFHVEFLAGAVLADDPGAFADYTRWTSGVLSARGMAPRFLVENLEQVRDAASQDLDEAERATLRDHVRAGIEAIESDPASGSDPADDGDRFQRERSLYLQAVRSGQRRAALNIALEALRNGASVPDVYREILQPVQYEIGRLWERNEMTVAREHMATAVTQYVVGQLYSHLEIPEASRGNALVTGVRGELHQLGANMVADVLEADGWNVRFLGTQLPHRGVLEAVDEHEPELIGISATVLFNLPAVAELIEELRSRFDDQLTILVGGSAFRTRPDVWEEMGADGYGGDLREAVRLADQLRREAS